MNCSNVKVRGYERRLQLRIVKNATRSNIRFSAHIRHICFNNTSLPQNSLYTAAFFI